jgi:uncharacterized membrane protein SpoIIM required for sporulation
LRPSTEARERMKKAITLTVLVVVLAVIAALVGGLPWGP